MEKLKQLIRETFDLWTKMRWLKMIDKETDKYLKYQQKLARQQSVVSALIKRYKEIYGEDLRRRE